MSKSELKECIQRPIMVYIDCLEEVTLDEAKEIFYSFMNKPKNDTSDVTPPQSINIHNADKLIDEILFKHANDVINKLHKSNERRRLSIMKNDTNLMNKKPWKLKEYSNSSPDLSTSKKGRKRRHFGEDIWFQKWRNNWVCEINKKIKNDCLKAQLINQRIINKKLKNKAFKLANELIEMKFNNNDNEIHQKIDNILKKYCDFTLSKNEVNNEVFYDSDNKSISDVDDVDETNCKEESVDFDNEKVFQKLALKSPIDTSINTSIIKSIDTSIDTSINTSIDTSISTSTITSIDTSINTSINTPMITSIESKFDKKSIKKELYNIKYNNDYLSNFFLNKQNDCTIC